MHQPPVQIPYHASVRGWPTDVDLGDVVATAGLSGFGVYSVFDLFRLWAGVSLLYWATPSYELVRRSRADLAIAAAAGRHRLLARAARVALWVPQAILAIFRPLDEVALWTGLNVIIGTNGIALLAMGLVEFAALRWVFG